MTQHKQPQGPPRSGPCVCEFQPRHKTNKQPQRPTHGQVPTGPAAREETRVTVTSLRLGQVARRSRGGGVGQTAFDDAGMRGDGFADLECEYRAGSQEYGGIRRNQRLKWNTVEYVTYSTSDISPLIGMKFPT